MLSLVIANIKVDLLLDYIQKVKHLHSSVPQDFVTRIAWKDQNRDGNGVLIIFVSATMRS